MPSLERPTTLPGEAFYRKALRILLEARIPFLIGGAFALQYHTGIKRETKDLDLMVRPHDCEAVLQRLAAAGYQTGYQAPHWLAKVFSEDYFVDVIFSSGNGLCAVDDLWFQHAMDGACCGIPVRFCPPEEMIWSKAFVLERERYDGADIAHLLRACGDRLDWRRVRARFGPHWRVLLSHLILYGYVYPGEQARIPSSVLRELLAHVEREAAEEPSPELAQLCRGTLLSRAQYQVDVEGWGYRDARLAPEGPLTQEEITSITPGTAGTSEGNAVTSR